MMEYQERPPTTRTSRRLEQADLLLSGLRTGQAPAESAPEQRVVVSQVQAALEIYLSYFYRHEPRRGDASSG